MSPSLYRVLAHAYWLVTFVLVLGAIVGCAHSLAAASVMIAARLVVLARTPDRFGA
jgi:hypothetical protein